MIFSKSSPRGLLLMIMLLSAAGLTLAARDLKSAARLGRLDSSRDRGREQEDDDDDDDDHHSGSGVAFNLKGGIRYTDLVDCARVLAAFGVTPVSLSGSTVFCPTNKGIKELAEKVRLPNTAALLAEINRTPPTARRDIIEQVVKFHVIPGNVLPYDTIPDGRTEYPTLLGTASIAVKKNATVNRVRIDDAGTGGGGRKVEGFDFVFSGNYTAGVDTYVVHAVEEPLCPPGTFCENEDEDDNHTEHGNEHEDHDHDGIEDDADTDDDGDNIPDAVDRDDGDMDNDGIPNALDADDDNDGILDAKDTSDADDDNDGIEDDKDWDDDNDGIDDRIDTSDNDDNQNGVQDVYDLAAYIVDRKSNLSDCRTFLDALSLSYASGTIFCPRNEAIKTLANNLGKASTAALLADITSVNTTLRLVVEAHFKLLIHPDAKWPKDAVPVTPRFTNLSTLLSPVQPVGSYLRFWKEDTNTRTTAFKGKISVTVPGSVQTAELDRWDETFEGPFNDTLAYVVHGIKSVLVPQKVYKNLDEAFSKQASLLATTNSLIGPQLRAAKNTGLTTLVLPSNVAWNKVGAITGLLPYAKNITTRKIAASTKYKTALATYWTIPAAIKYNPTTLTLDAAYTTADAGALHKPELSTDRTVTGDIAPANVGRVVDSFLAGQYIILVVDTPLFPAWAVSPL